MEYRPRSSASFLNYLFTFAHCFFCAAEILARAAADRVATGFEGRWVGVNAVDVNAVAA
jgi:hypothetical protein